MTYVLALVFLAMVVVRVAVALSEPRDLGLFKAAGVVSAIAAFALAIAVVV